MGFGGGGGGSSRTVTTQELSPEQRRLLEPVVPVARKFIKRPPRLFPESAIAPLDPLQKRAQRAAVRAATGPVQDAVSAGVRGLDRAALSGDIGNVGLGALVSGLGVARPAQEFLLSGDVLFPETNPALQAAIEAAVRPIEEQFTQSILPGLRRGAITSGQLGSSRQGVAEGLASQAFLRQVGDTSAQLQNEAFQSGLGAMIGALQPTITAGGGAAEAGVREATRALFAAPSIAAAQTLPAQILGAVGAQRREVEQAKLQEQQQRFLAEQIIPFAVAQDVAGLAFGFPGARTTSEAEFPGISPLQAALAGGSLGLLGAGAFGASPLVTAGAGAGGAGIGALLALL